MKVTLSGLKKNFQGINSGVDEAKNQNNDLEHKGENKTANHKKKKESKKMRIVYATTWTTSTIHSNIGTISVPERQGKEQEIGNLFEQ